jgi:predicted NAD-dependent protein-ADP-ribosyltransferase YbiA (DUF1768 family)
MPKKLTESEKYARYKKELLLSDEKYSKRIANAKDPAKVKKLFKERDDAKERLQVKWFWSHR